MKSAHMETRRLRKMINVVGGTAFDVDSMCILDSVASPYRISHVQGCVRECASPRADSISYMPRGGARTNTIGTPVAASHGPSVLLLGWGTKER